MKIIEVMLEARAQINDNRPDFIKFLVDTCGFRQQKVDDMIAQHNDIATPEDFLEFLACDEKNGLYNHEFVLKVPLEQASVAPPIIVEDNFEIMDAQALQVANVINVEVKDISQPEICSICDQARKKHKQF